MSGYTLLATPPSAKDYCHLRNITSLTPKSLEAAKLALPNTWFGVHVVYGGETIGMGRIIGDGGCFFQVVDVAVQPHHQRRGLGDLIMTRLMEYFEENAPVSAYISLIADGDAEALYRQYGFKPTAPDSIGMWRLKA
jgi:ribosomal protein S18 acetylase RimI-like enzyme